jgi:branched-chain amino acid aminotransferase
MTTTVYLNGDFVSAEEARVSLFDHGYLFGDSIFETLRSYDGVLFRLDAHLDRLLDSARYMKMTLPASRAELSDLCYRTLARSGLSEAYLRVTVSRGVGERGIDPERCLRPTLSIVAKEPPTYPADGYVAGIPTVVVGVRKVADEALSGRVKGGNFQNQILAKLELNQHGVIEGFLLNPQGFVVEGTVSNVFLVKHGALRTPSGACGCLEGITRNVVMEIASRQLGIPVEAGFLTRYDLYTADECFLTNTLMEVLPVSRVDGRPVGDGTPGPLTVKLGALYKRLVAAEGRSR